MTVFESAYTTKPHTHVYQFSVRLGPNSSALEYWGSLLLWSITYENYVVPKPSEQESEKYPLWKLENIHCGWL